MPSAAELLSRAWIAARRLRDLLEQRVAVLDQRGELAGALGEHAR